MGEKLREREVGGGNVRPWKKKKRIPVPNIPGNEWENRSTRGKNALVGRRENPTDINLHEGSTAIKAQGNNNKNQKEVS